MICLWLPSCGTRATQPPPSAAWATGFWFWDGSSGSVTTAGATPIDVIYCQVSTVEAETPPMATLPRALYAKLPDHLPPARKYWLVFRFDERAVPPMQLVPRLVDAISNVREDARDR